MRFLSRPWDVYYPKLLGTYELEVQPWISEILELNVDRVIVIGAAEGYYAVGLAWRRQDWTVDAFEVHPEATDLLMELARLNGVENRITLLGLCDIPALSAALRAATTPVIIMDVEGAEAVLLDPRVVPGLVQAYILVELHEHMIPGICETLGDRFGNTHTIAEVAQNQRRPSDFPIPLAGLNAAAYLGGAALQFMAELRAGRQSWLFMSPQTRKVTDMPKSASIRSIPVRSR